MTTTLLMALIIGLFVAIHLVEVTAFLARIAGVRLGMRASAYTLQNSVFMITRMFSMAMLPVMGYLVDIGIPRSSYIAMTMTALFGASLGGAAILLIGKRIVYAFEKVLEKMSMGKPLILLLLSIPKLLLRRPTVNLHYTINWKIFKLPIFWLSGSVFAIYATSVLFMFYLGLVYPDYRMTISQLSGVTNAVAAVILTFVIEPKISVAIDSEGGGTYHSTSLIINLLIGRIFGVGIISPALFLLAASF